MGIIVPNSSWDPTPSPTTTKFEQAGLCRKMGGRDSSLSTGLGSCTFEQSDPFKVLEDLGPKRKGRDPGLEPPTLDAPSPASPLPPHKEIPPWSAPHPAGGARVGLGVDPGLIGPRAGPHNLHRWRPPPAARRPQTPPAAGAKGPEDREAGSPQSAATLLRPDERRRPREPPAWARPLPAGVAAPRLAGAPPLPRSPEAPRPTPLESEERGRARRSRPRGARLESPPPLLPHR